MPQMTPAQARGQDLELTEVARGYNSPISPVADLLFPFVSTTKRGGKILVFGTDSYKLLNTQRAPGANIKRVQFGYAGDDYALVDHDLEAVVPDEIGQEADSLPLDLRAMHVNGVQDLMARERENMAAQLATNPANYALSNKAALSGTDMWSDPASDPQRDIMEAREVVRRRIGRRPDALVVSPIARFWLSIHPKITARLPGGNGADNKLIQNATLDDLSRILEVRVVEGDATYHDGSSFVDIWGNTAVLAFTNPGAAREMGSPNYGYTYRLSGRPSVTEPYYENNQKSWIYGVHDAYKPVLVGADAGFLFSNVGTDPAA